MNALQESAAPSGRAEGPFAGRVALITGGGSGIGYAFARKFTEAGGRVTLFGRTLAKLEHAARALTPGTAIEVAGRHELTADARRAVESTRSRWGRLDVLFNNAGSYRPGRIADTADEDWDESLAANLSGPFRMTRESLPLLRESAGVVINNSSTLGLRPVAGAAAYAAAKAGLILLAQATAIEEAAYGVRALAICPGVVDTPIHAGRAGTTPESRRAFLEEAGKLHPLGRVGTADEVAELALFLASNASAWTTGAVITIDGGISLT